MSSALARIHEIDSVGVHALPRRCNLGRRRCPRLASH
jgi:hypothetical protein